MNRVTTILRARCGLRARLLMAFVIAASAGVVRAEEALSPDADAKYRSSLKEALAEYDASHFEEARILFRRAHEIYPNARTLRSIGMASFELRDYVAAVRALSAALVESRKPLSLDQRTHAQGLLDRSRMFVDVYTIKVTPADARILIDGRVPESEPDGTVLLGFGTHNLEASKAGFLVRTLVLNVRGGEHKDLAMTLERKPVVASQPASSTLTQSPQAQPPAEAASESAGDGHWGAGWFFAAGGAALAAGGAGALWLFQNKELSRCRTPPPGNGPCNNESTILGLRNVAVGATVATGVGAVTLAVIGILNRDSSSVSSPAPSTQQSSLSCAVYVSGFLCARTF